MSNSAAALKEAVEFEKQALEKYKEAVALVNHQETKETLQKLTTEKQQTIESMHWIIMADLVKLKQKRPLNMLKVRNQKVVLVNVHSPVLSLIWVSTSPKCLKKKLWKKWAICQKYFQKALTPKFHVCSKIFIDRVPSLRN
jgi:rubrerythrin